MNIKVVKCELAEIQALRDLFLQENNFQFVYNKCHGAGWADTYHFSLDGNIVGYGSVWGKDKREDRDTIFEFFLLKPFRKFATVICTEFKKVSASSFMTAQTNDLLLSGLIFECAKNITAEAILFEDGFESALSVADSCLIKNNNDDSEYFLKHNGEIVASGGYVWNYNFPFIDIYYEVKEEHRRKGFGSLITQELKREAYRLKRRPAARCNVTNLASKATLLKSGMKICGYILTGELK